VKSNNNSFEVHLQLNNNKHVVDGALVNFGSLCARVNQHRLVHQLWMRLFWPFWDEPKPFNLNQTKH
jgi:hypothetical protein